MPSILQGGNIAWITGFKGLLDSAVPGQTPTVTPDLRNVKVRYGKVFGRGGMAKYLAISTAAGNPPIIGLFPFSRDNQSANQLLRLTLTKLEKLNTGTSAWDDISGTAFANLATTRPQFAIIDDILIMTDEGIQRPRKYTGSGNSATIGGTPPFCKVIGAYQGFAFLGDISDNGTFTDIVEGYRILQYSDDWDVKWSDCDASIAGRINLSEAPGPVVRVLQLGRDLVAHKTDGFVVLTKVGGGIVFTHQLLPLPIGTNSPLTWAAIGERFQLGLCTDGLIYKISSSGGTAISDEVLANTLHIASVRDLKRYQYSRAIIDSEEGLYLLMYDRTGLTQQFLDSYVGYNYLTGEWIKGRLAQNVVASAAYKPAKTEREVALLSTNTLIEEFDAAATDDDGTRISRYWTTGWQKLAGGEEGWFTGALILMKKSKRARIKVSVAVDLADNFMFHQVASLTGGDPTADNVEVNFTPPPVKGQWFNVKIEMFHTTGTDITEVQRVGFMGIPLHQVSLSQGPAISAGQGWS